jgi:hypothetical protein
MPLSSIPTTQRRQLIKLAANQSQPYVSGLTTRIQSLLASRGITANYQEIVDCLK